MKKIKHIVAVLMKTGYPLHTRHCGRCLAAPHPRMARVNPRRVGCRVHYRHSHHVCCNSSRAIQGAA